MLRRQVRLLGVGTLAFGVVPFFWPRLFVRLSGFNPPADPGAEAIIRSVGARDICFQNLHPLLFAGIKRQGSAPELVSLRTRMVRSERLRHLGMVRECPEQV